MEQRILRGIKERAEGHPAGALACGGRGRLVAVLPSAVALLFSMVAPIGVTVFGAVA